MERRQPQEAVHGDRRSSHEADCKLLRARTRQFLARGDGQGHQQVQHDGVDEMPSEVRARWEVRAERLVELAQCHGDSEEDTDAGK